MAREQRTAEQMPVTPGAGAAPQRVALGWRRAIGPRIRCAAAVFWLLFAINTVNYLDRFVAVAVGPTLKQEFHLHDRDIGLLSSAFLLIYTLSAVPLGLLADRVARAKVVAAGVAVWSVASGATAVVRGFFGLFVTRAAVGIGEASYFPAGTALLSAYYPLEKRARAMSRWGAGQLVGIAAAFALSALLAHLAGPQYAWRLAFLFTAPPGLVLAVLMWRVAESPTEGEGERPAAARAAARPMRIVRSPGRLLRLYARVEARRIAQVLRIRTVTLVIVLQALTYIVITPTITFLPIYVRADNGPYRLSEGHASILTGLIIVIGGLAAALLGGPVADWLSRRFAGGRVLVAAVGFGAALPAYVVMLLAHSIPVFAAAALVTVLAVSMPAGPLTASAQDVTPRALRATAVAVALLLAHVLGDVWSPGVVGMISTRLHEHSNTALLLVGTPALALATLAGIAGARLYARELAREGGV